MRIPLFQRLITHCGRRIGVEYENGILCQVPLFNFGSCKLKQSRNSSRKNGSRGNSRNNLLTDGDASIMTALMGLARVDNAAIFLTRPRKFAFPVLNDWLLQHVFPEIFSICRS